MNWEDISLSARNTMKELGEFSPTINPANREVKGWIGGKVYYSARELKMMADHFNEVAEWLDKRANQEEYK